MTVLENLRLGTFTTMGEAEMNRRLEVVFQLFPLLQEKLHQLAGTLSGGEQGMAAIGRGMMGRTKILLLDEPSLGLAPVLVDEFFKAIKRINEEGRRYCLLNRTPVNPSPLQPMAMSFKKVRSWFRETKPNSMKTISSKKLF